MSLLDDRAFDCANGLWKGKKPPYITAGVVRNTNFRDNGRIDLSDVAVLEVEERQLARRRLQFGDIILERSGGGPRQPVGRVVFFEQKDGVWSFSNFTSRIRVKDQELFDPRFVMYFLMHFYEGGATSALQSHTTGIRNLDWRRYRESARVPVLALPEQRRIAAFLSAVQQAIEQQEKLIALTAEFKKALMHKLFTEGTRGEPQKETEIGLIPESWQVARLGEVAKIERGKFSHRPRNEPRFYGGETPFVQTGDVSNCDGHIRSHSQTLNEDGVSISKVFHAGTILITIAANIGYAGILCFDSACPDSLIGILASEVLDVEFLNFYLGTQQAAMDRLAPRGTQKNINIQFLKPWPVPLPPFDEQLEIASALNRVDAMSISGVSRKQQLDSLFRTLLHQLMTAQLRVDQVDMSELKALGIETD